MFIFKFNIDYSIPTTMNLQATFPFPSETDPTRFSVSSESPNYWNHLFIPKFVLKVVEYSYRLTIMELTNDSNLCTLSAKLIEVQLHKQIIFSSHMTLDSYAKILLHVDSAMNIAFFQKVTVN